MGTHACGVTAALFFIVAGRALRGQMRILDRAWGAGRLASQGRGGYRVLR